MNKRLIIETYIAYMLCQKYILELGDIGDGLLIGYVAEVTSSSNKDSIQRYIRRCIEDLKEVGALKEDARVRGVIDQSERELWGNWEAELYQPENIIYQGKNSIRYGNLKTSHLSPVDYTFTLVSYDSLTKKNLQKLYRIVLTINSEYSDDKRSLAEKVNSYLDEYIQIFGEDDSVISDFFETLEYLKTAIRKEQDFEDIYRISSIDPKEDFEDKLYDIELMLNDFKQKQGFAPEPVELTNIERIASRRRQTEIKLPKKLYQKTISKEESN